MKKRGLTVSSPPLAKRRRCPPPPTSPAKRQDGPSSRPRAFRCGKHELALLLFETPSGFAILTFGLDIIDDPKAMEVIWTYFAQNWYSCHVVWLNEFQTFEDKSSAINQNTGVNEKLAEMIKKWHCPGQKMAVGKPEYKEILEEKLEIPCLYGPTVMELMWCIQKCIPSSVTGEKSQLTEEDRLPISKGLETFLGSYGCIVKPEMINQKIIETAGALFECDSIEKKYSKAMLSARDLIKDVSGINCEHWSLLKIATALKVIWWPAANSYEKISAEETSQLKFDALLYESVLNKESCLSTYKHMVYAHEVKTEKKKQLKLLLQEAKEQYEAEQKQDSTLRNSQLAETVEAVFEKIKSRLSVKKRLSVIPCSSEGSHS